MKITEKTWLEYITRLSRLNEEAGKKMADYINRQGTQDVDALIEYAAALVQKYGEGTAELACQMYDALAEKAGVKVPPAEPAAPADYGETARMVNATKQSPPQLQGGVSRLVKRAGADTTLKNAIRDGAEWAWVPHGDTCPFCITLASRGWQKASQKALKGGHAEHIHAHCNCEYAIRFDSRTSVAGYDPEKYLAQYNAAGGDINVMRRAQYAENKIKINAQKRAAYAARKAKNEVNPYSGLHMENKPVTLEAVNNVTEFACDTLDKTGQSQLQNAHKRLLAAASSKPLGVEVGRAYNLQMQPLTQMLTGPSTGGSILIPDFDEPYIAMHTHPDCNMFSSGDLLNFASRSNLRMLTAVGHDGHVYALEKTSTYQHESALARVHMLQVDVAQTVSENISDEDKLSRVESLLLSCIKELNQYGIRFYG